jgi:DnaJ C terminal domain
MALDGQQNGDIRATLAVSWDEAQFGTTRTLNLPGGRQINVTLPAGLHDGQVLRLEGQGQPVTGGKQGALILTIAVAPAENFGAAPFPQGEANARTEFIPTPPPPPSSSSPSYPGVTTGATIPASNPGLGSGAYSNANAPRQASTPIYRDPQPPVYLQSQQYMQGTQGIAGQGAQQQQQGGRQRRGFSPVMIISMIVLVLLIIAGSGLIYFAAVYEPQQQHIHGTATAQVQQTGTAQVNASSTANAQATVTAQASQTAAVQAQQTAQASATVAAYQSTYTNATAGTPVLNDALTGGNTASNWDEASGQCSFTSSGYQTNETTKGLFIPCMAQSPTFSDFAYQVKMTINQGDGGGMLFRSDSVNSKYFFFYVDHTGSYELYLYVDSSGKDAKELAFGNVGNTFNTGYNQSNTLTVIAKGNVIYLYVNQVFLNRITVNNSSALSSGQIGLFADAVNGATKVTYTNAQVWKL